MTFHVVHPPNSSGARSPFHVVETQTGREVEWVNHFLDRECVRCLANTSLRSYAMDLLHFLRWWTSVNHTGAITENAVASVLPDYVRFQAGQQPRPAPATINRRVTYVSRCDERAGIGLLPLLLVALVAGLWTLPPCAQPVPRERT